MSPIPLKKIFDPNKIPLPKNTEDNFYEVRTTKCTKTLYKTDTIRPTVFLPISEVFDGTVSLRQITGNIHFNQNSVLFMVKEIFD